MIVRIGEFQAAEGQGDALHQFLISLTAYITGSKGCISYEVLSRQDEPMQFAVIERWVSIEDHRASVEHFPQDEMQAAMSLFAAAPTGRYYQA
ncbi:putative quinol monooxygenase [Shewanella atlantica]|uniref:Antibiotic biosynthesis monooxygenase n=1 Tax=Shewanella atlantica TaxID=271099 RepID=A0A3S0KCR0_9GAMM|nr:antibiotic biosynthesis monooxygenase family protein [Shewanella atlantica]RTR27683.1 antibiotic biosynthesis monooxygenase [Shewanella atlantica]